MTRVRIGTRRSNLALWQANHVARLLKATHEAVDVEIVPFVTEGDRNLSGPLYRSGGKGLFIKELEVALERGDVDLAVHSMKDVPGHLPAGFEIAAVPEREVPYDALITTGGKQIGDLRKGAIIGTASPRRGAQFKQLRPDVQIVSLRGSVETRLRRLEEGAFDATLLACAGLKRLGLEAHISEVLLPPRFVPAVGQGALALEVRAGDARLQELVRPLHHAETADAVAAERGFMARLEGGCSLPVAAHAVIEGNEVALEARILMPDGSRMIGESIRGPRADAEALGRSIAERMLAAGGEEILAACLQE